MMCAEPGVSPIRKPSTEPRAIGMRRLAPLLAARQQFAQFRGAITSPPPCGRGVERISPSPNSPTATGTMPMPSPSSAMSNE